MMAPLRARSLFLALLAAAAFQSCGFAGEAARAVCAGGALTEIVYALGLADRLAGVDDTSLYPPEVRALPRVGYLRNLSAEGVLALRPDLLLAAAEAGPAVALDRIRAGKTRVETIASDYTPEGVIKKIAATASALGVPERGEALIRRYRADWASAREAAARFADRPKALFVLAHGGGAMQASGRGTAADAMIRLAGAVNAIDGFEGYRPLTAESALAANPDAILLTAEGETRLGGIDALWRIPGLASTPAGKARRAIAMEASYLLGFGPRLPSAVRELAGRLRGAPL
jgi:iron complex transport system substrate-binding protein